MNIVFHEKYREVYSSDPAAKKGRLDKAVEELRPLYPFIEPKMATEEDIFYVHTKSHFDMVSRKSSHLLTLSLLAAGGAISASEQAMQGNISFALIRPPGHHASPSDCWGFCWFNNIAVAIERLRTKQLIKRALILDFDLHFGDGTKNFFTDIPEVTYIHMGSVKTLPQQLSSIEQCDIVGLSAGFDRHLEDWGGLLSTDDYLYIGQEVKKMADTLCPNKIFAVLEGGYNHDVLGENIKALLEGLKEN
ncbi:MAG TPA: histone deacetylase family protein [Desulfohalobiaceae bacterium]|nr:histone deacetylase family protein [Desulfohalobiaceae bacterium]